MKIQTASKKKCRFRNIRDCRELRNHIDCPICGGGSFCKKYKSHIDGETYERYGQCIKDNPKGMFESMFE